MQQPDVDRSDSRNPLSHEETFSEIGPEQATRVTTQDHASKRPSASGGANAQHPQKLPYAATNDFTSIRGNTTIGASVHDQQTLSPSTEVHVPFTSYSFLDDSFLSNLPSADSQYLQTAGCFQLPEATPLATIMEAFFRYVSPHLPLIAEGPFWEMFFNSSGLETPSPKMSLFVLYAMLLISCSVSTPPACTSRHHGLSILAGLATLNSLMND